MKMNLTFDTLSSCGACYNGYNKLHNYMYDVDAEPNKSVYNKSKHDEIHSTPINLKTILKSNGVLDTIWCLRFLPHEYRFDDYNKILLSTIPMWLDFIDTTTDHKQVKELVRGFRKYIGGTITPNEMRKNIKTFKTKPNIDDYNFKFKYASILDSLLTLCERSEHSNRYHSLNDMNDMIVDDLYNVISELGELKLNTNPLVNDIIDQMEKFN